MTAAAAASDEFELQPGLGSSGASSPPVMQFKLETYFER